MDSVWSVQDFYFKKFCIFPLQVEFSRISETIVFEGGGWGWWTFLLTYITVQSIRSNPCRRSDFTPRTTLLQPLYLTTAAFFFSLLLPSSLTGWICWDKYRYRKFWSQLREDSQIPIEDQRSKIHKVSWWLQKWYAKDYFTTNQEKTKREIKPEFSPINLPDLHPISGDSLRTTMNELTNGKQTAQEWRQRELILVFSIF